MTELSGGRAFYLDKNNRFIFLGYKVYLFMTGLPVFFEYFIPIIDQVFLGKFFVLASSFYRFFYFFGIQN